MPAPNLLDNTPILRLLPAHEREQLLAGFESCEYAFGDPIVREGESADGYYLLTRGRARVLRTDGEDEVSLRLLHAGDGFGEMALLRKSIRAATVRACEPVTAMRLSRETFESMIESSPQLREYIERQVTERSLENFLHEFTSFGKVPIDALHALLDALEPESVSAGQMLIREGDPSGPLYIVESGQFRVCRGGKDLAFIRHGDFFGELSSLRGSARSASVVALSDSNVWRLTPEKIAAITDAHPELDAVIRGRIASYDADTSRMPLDVAHMLTESGTRIADSATPSPKADSARIRRRWRFPFVWQIDEADCGAAALGMVARWLGCDVSLPYVRELAGTGIDGTGINDICRAGDEIGLRASPVKRAPTQIANLDGPAIIHQESGHWVVLIKSRGRRVKIADPAKGISWQSIAEFAKTCSGHAILFANSANGETVNLMRPARSAWAWAKPLLKPFRGAMMKAAVVTLLVAAMQLVFPVLTQIIVDDVVPNAILTREISQLNTLIMVLGGTLVLTLLLTLLQRVTIGHMAARIDGSILNFIMDRMLSLPMSYFNRRTAADIQRRLEGAREVRQFLVHGAVNGLLAGIQLLAFVVLMAIYSPKMALIVLVMAPIYLGVMLSAAKVLRPAYVSLESSESRYQTLQDDVIHGIETVKSAGAETSFRELMVRDFVTISRSQGRSNFNIFCYEGTVQALSLLTTLMFLWLGARLVIQEELSIGAFIAVHMLFAMSYSHIQTIMNGWRDLQLSTVLLNRINDVVECRTEAVMNEDTHVVPSIAGEVRLDGVRFSYGPGSPEILRGVSFRVPARATIAIVGRSGAGKSTLARCLAGLERPIAGNILYDDVPAETIDLSELRTHIGFVPQRSHLFSGTVLNNIAFGDDKPNVERAIAAAQAANAFGFIQQLPDGLDSRIETVAPFLSNGQRQSLAIARALYREPAIVVFDEATSGIDVETARVIHHSLTGFLQDRTAFIVTHDIETVRLADRILVLEDGRIVEEGSFEQLLARQGVFRNLFRERLGDSWSD
ncbi:MAG: ABC-type bacteriocin/lantibiotic exporter with double-glycine peptidase domain [Rhodothermales bacterium]|jgi:ABC-type bacteriocin/lantibiotic exporter with double-glycine peptidase domain/CRP-like cAMP-binding protein